MRVPSLAFGFAAAAVAAAAATTTTDKPNLVYILNDDTDVMLGSADTLRQTNELLGAGGAEFTQFRTLSPKCTPSRTGQLAGRHYHNVRPNPTGPGLNQTTMFDEDALFPQLHAAG